VTGRHAKSFVILTAVVFLHGCGGTTLTPSPTPSVGPVPSQAAAASQVPTRSQPSIAPATSSLDGVPDPDGRIAFGRYTRYDDFFGPLALLFAIDPDGSDLVQLTTDDAASPRWSPDGSTLAFTVPRPDGSWQIATVPARGGPARVLTSGPGMSELPSWSPDGSWIAYDYSPTVGGPGFHDVLYRMDADGRNPRLLGDPDAFDVQPAVSPDGTKVAFLRLNADGEFGSIWVRDIASGEELQLVAAGSDVETPAWSPDGRWVMYTRDLTVLRVASDGSGSPVVIIDKQMNPRAYKASYAPDGRHIVLGCNGPEGDAICIANADGSGLALIGDLPGYLEHWSDWGRAAP
jgi:dipeptidyl aminopeptidase/acylaminoacyl peptidase